MHVRASMIWSLAALFAWAGVAQVDLTGTYDVGTLTPLERPEAFGDNLYLSEEQAQEIEQRETQLRARLGASSDPDRAAPEAGGRIGGYNYFWLDRGAAATTVDGRFRTSIISEPANGRIPAMTAQGAARMKRILDSWTIVWRNPDPTASRNDGTAWWLKLDGPGPYDQIEQRPLAERCIIGSRSTTGPPMLPNIYNNTKSVVQTDDHVMILTEMNHDVRTIRIADQREGAMVPSWFGDSIGRWEGDTLVVETRGFRDTPPLSGADENLVVTERFRKAENGALEYAFTIDDPTVWSQSWSGEYTWQPTDGKVYEYACHEGNYALGNIMRGARLLERDALE